jgi:ELWxxDGT repeat protein
LILSAVEVTFPEKTTLSSLNPIAMKNVYKGVSLQILATLIYSLLGTVASAQTPVRLTAGGSSGSEPKEFALFNGRLYFSAKTNDDVFGSPPVIDGQEVYSTDGTLAGTSLLKNINTNAGQGSDPREFTEYNGKLYFSATSETNGRELWVTDGTAGGTVLFKDINPGGGSGNPQELTPCNGKLYFVAQSGTQRQLWVSDGTVAGTQRLSDALGVSTGGNNPMHLTCSGDKLFYSIQFSNDLWFTNGTAANTKFIKGGPISPANPDGPRLFISLSQFTALDGKLIFRGNSQGTEDEPWVSDGTPEGTFTLDVQPGGLGSFPTDFYAFNGRVYFNSATLNSFWSTDGTIVGTKRIKSSFTAKEPTGFNGKLYFFSGNQLWNTDGTEAGTQLVKDLSGGAG